MKDYSHGMKNKMQMLVNIIAQPIFLLLDEPLTSLDVVVAEEMKQLLRSLKQDRVTVFSTHIMDLALDLCDEIVLLSHGVLEHVDKENLDSHEFKERLLRHCGRKSMNKTLRISFSLKNTYRVNGILYSLKQIPLVKRLLPDSLYGVRELKILPIFFPAYGKWSRYFLGSCFILYLWWPERPLCMRQIQKAAFTCIFCFFSQL